MTERHGVFYVSYPLLPVSEESCGGAEQMLSTLEHEINRRGHRTTVAACAGSHVRGELYATGDEVSESDGFESREAQHRRHILMFLRHSQRASGIDLVHDKSGHFWRAARYVDQAVLSTLHLPRSFYPKDAFQDLPPNLFFNCVSETQRQSFADLPNMVGVVQNGVPIDRFRLSTEKKDYLLWMGRICEEKAPHLAIEVARQTGLPLVLAGQVYPFRYHEDYYVREIRPNLGLENPPVCFIETPNIQMKKRLLREARAVLIPSLVDETSSLVAMEAMASGTPVIGFRRGAIPEVVVDGETGFVVDDVEQMANAVWRTQEINPHACRVHVETHYSAERMATEYEALYERVIGMSRSVELSRVA